MGIELLLFIIMCILAANLLFSLFKFIWHLFTRMDDNDTPTSSFLDLGDDLSAQAIHPVSRPPVRPPLRRLMGSQGYPPNPHTTKFTESKSVQTGLPRSKSDDSLHTVSLGSDHTHRNLRGAPTPKTK